MSHLIDTIEGRRRLQTVLAVKGFYKGPLDGILGEASAKAIRDFRQSIGLAPTAVIEPKVLDALGLGDPIYDPPKSLANAAFSAVAQAVILFYLKGKIMNSDQLGGIVRAVLAALVAYLAGKGIIPASAGGDIIASVSTLLITLWSIWTNRNSALAPKA